MAKNAFLSSSTHFHRKIRPLETQTTIPIQRLSIHYKNKKSFIRLHPSKIHIQSSYFLSLLNSNCENISIGPNNNIKRQELLSATERMIMDEKNYSDSFYTGKIDLQNDKPRRPPNAFLLYSGSLRKKIRRTFPEYSNSDVSKLLGIMWRTASEEIKDKFTRLAYEEKQRHKLQHPNFEYNLKKQGWNSGESSASQNNLYDNEWLNDINEFLQQTKEFEKNFNGNLNPEDMKEDAIMLISSMTEDSELDTSKKWLNSSLFEDNLDPNSWMDMINSITLLYPEYTEENIHNNNNAL
ncbi:hypothetical protein BJ944DRAFT_205923 [Cunninghamella echinulata]|nr:hypothetical protein BJ944DRAFT_205923 [Cunninghamella echinulata]